MHSSHHIRILFAGGCHVVGYPVGPQHAFPRVVERQLAESDIPCESEYLPYVALHHSAKVIETCRRFHPDILVLQLANFELGNELGPYLLSRLGFKLKKKSSSSRANAQIVNRPRYALRASLKQWIDRRLGHPLVDFPAVADKYQAFLTATADCAGHVLLASPTPCADPTSQYYRLRALPMVQDFAARYNCVSIDLTSLGPAVEERTLGRDMFFADAMHLGIAGQEAVGRCFAVHIRKVVESAAFTS